MNSFMFKLWFAVFLGMQSGGYGAVFVKENAKPNGDGSSWATAVTNLQEGIDVCYAAGGGEVWVAAGIYVPKDSDFFKLYTGVNIFGGFPADAKDQRADCDELLDRRWRENRSILSGDIGASDTDSDADGIPDVPGGDSNDNCSSVIVVSDGAEQGDPRNGDSVISGFFITGGDQFGLRAEICRYGSISVNNCEFIGNGDSGVMCRYLVEDFQLSHSVLCGNGRAAISLHSSEFSVCLNNCVLVGNGYCALSGRTQGATIKISSSVVVENTDLYDGDPSFIYANNSILGDISTNLFPRIRNSFLTGALTTPLLNGNLSGDPLFVRSPNDGGDGWGGGPDSYANNDYGDLHLQTGSPCIDAGDNRFIGNCGLDLDGSLRVVDGDENGVSDVDIGVFEFGSEAPLSFCSHAFLVEQTNGCRVLSFDQVGTNLVATVPSGSHYIEAWAMPAIGQSLAFSHWQNEQEEQLNTNPLVLENEVSNTVWVAHYTNVVASTERRVYVSPAGAGDGTSWSNSTHDIQAAIEAAALIGGGGEVWLAGGVYRPSMVPIEGFPVSTDNFHFTLRAGVSVYGGFSGNEENITQRDLSCNRTILSADIGVSDTDADGDGVPDYPGGDSGDNCQRVLYITSTEEMPNQPIIEGVSVVAAKNGGMVCNSDMLNISRCIFERNHGGGVVSSGSPTFHNCLFRNNTNTEGGAGASVYAFGNRSTLFEGCHFQDNISSSSGGGFCLLYSLGNEVVMSSCTFSGNEASKGGGIYAGSRSPFSLVNTVLHDNKALIGAGLFLSGESGNIINSTFVSNSADIGGDIYASDTNVFPSVSNCIFKNDGNNPLFCQLGSFSNNLVHFQDSIDLQEGNIISDPQFVDIKNPAGPDGIWGTFDDGLHLQSSSPAINTGDNRAINAEFDFCGEARVNRGIVDMGAYEADISDIPVNVTVENGEGTGAYLFDSSVEIHADIAPEGYCFSHWQVFPTGFPGALQSATSETTLVTVPGNDIRLIPFYVNLDIDQDGLSDAWERIIVDHDLFDDILGVEDVLCSDDYDGDGRLNEAEYLAGSDPVNTFYLSMFFRTSPVGNDYQQLVWNETPGTVYNLESSSNRLDWVSVEGYPRVSEQLVGTHDVEILDDVEFLRVSSVDTVAPILSGTVPEDGGFAVSRFGDVVVSISDVSGLNPASILMTVGDLGTFEIVDEELSFSAGTLIFDTGGDTALGGYGDTISIELIISDVAGNYSTNAWSFDLESEPIVTTNLFVFGSPDAQRSGQHVGAIPTRALASLIESGPIRMSSGTDPWELTAVEEDKVAISYSGSTPPEFSEGMYLSNLTPVSVSDIFYRRITGTTNDVVSKTLSLYTVDVPLTDIVQQGSLSSSGGDLVFQVGNDGLITRAVSFDGNLSLPPVGFALDGTSIDLKNDGFDVTVAGALPNLDLGQLEVSVGDDPVFMSISADELNFLYEPSLRFAMDIGLFSGLDRFELIFRGDCSDNMVFRVNAPVVGKSASATLFDLSLHGWIVPAGTILGVPVIVHIKPGIKMEIAAEAKIDCVLTSGLHRQLSSEIGIRYDEKKHPALELVSDSRIIAQVDLPDAAISGELSLNGRLLPKVSALVYGLAGASISIAPGMGIVCETGQDHVLTGRFEADLSLVVDAEGPLFEDFDSLQYRRELWSDQWHLFPEIPALKFEMMPQSQSVFLGEDVSFTCEVNQGSDVEYQWYFNKFPLVGNNRDRLDLLNVNKFHSGSYHVEALRKGEATNIVSEVAVLSLEELPTAKPGIGMVLIPGGTNAGTNPVYKKQVERDGEDVWVNNDYSSTYPEHYSLTVDDFYMDRYEITKLQWDEVYNWAITNGYSFASRGDAASSKHPVSCISWYDCVKWCNARSEKEGKTPCYRSGSTITRSGYPDICDLEANGYRLPSSVEWEYAARGGRRNRMFPWGNKISHRYANYYSTGTTSSYNVSEKGAHPTYRGLTSTVGSFYPNGYGLYDMVGNVEEWTNSVSPYNSDRKLVKGGCSYYKSGLFIGTSRVYLASFDDLTPDSLHSLNGFRTICH